ncbi:MAG: hypothetical protein V3R65_00460 [Acidiferrobacterales bacterium]
MKLIEAIPDLVNFFILLDNGQLGYYNAKGEFLLQKSFTENFADFTGELLKRYKTDPDASGYRIAIVYPTREKRQWKSASLALEPDIMRRLYPTSGPRQEEITSFQKRNIEKSIYQGIELLMEYQDESLPGNQIYCPVLYYRRKTLSDYLSVLAREERPDDKSTPVLEVLNFLAPVPMGKRSSEVIGRFTKAIYEGVINKSVRKDSYDFLKHRDGSISIDSVNKEVADLADQAIVSIFGERRKEGFSGMMRMHCSPQTYERVSRWLEEPYKYIEPDQLKFYSRFRQLGMDGLIILSDKHPIFRAPLQTQLLARDTSDKWNMYLIDGVVELEAEDGEKFTVEAMTPQATTPIASLKPRMYTVTSVTQVKFLWMMDDFVDSVVNIDIERKKSGLRIDQ